MTKYLLKRILHGVFSVVVIVAIVMIMIYSLMDKKLIFAHDSGWTKQLNNNKTVYEFRKWKDFGYLDYVAYGDWISGLIKSGELAAEDRTKVASLGRTPDKDSETVREYVQKFTEFYESQGYTVKRLDAVMQGGTKIAVGGNQALFAYRDIPLYIRVWNYFTNIIKVDNIHRAEEVQGERGISFTWFDPAYGGTVFSPAVIGNGTYHKYLLYCDSQFPFIHQNLVSISLGKSYSVKQNIEITDTMTRSQGTWVGREVYYPTGFVDVSGDDLHTATYQAGSLNTSALLAERYTDDYTNVDTLKSGMSRMGYSFTIGIISVILTYLIGVPIAIWMAQKKDKLVDQIGSVYVVFITAMPSLAYIFIVKAIGNATGIPTTFDMNNPTWLMYVLPIISLSLRPIAGLMRWLRRYMVDQQNADYVKFARSTGISEGQIFRKHILKNAAIPIIHGIPGAILFSLVGALITERVYVVPGVGGLMIEAINFYDNGVIVGVTLFYAVLSIVSLIIGDILMSVVDPRINFTSKAR